MDQRIRQDESPESRPNLRSDDGTVFIYSHDRGVYEPYERSKEEREASPKGGRQPESLRLIKFWRQHWAATISTFIAFLGLCVASTYTYYAAEQVCETRKAVKAANDSVATASASMNLDERAWVGVVDITRIGDQIKVEFVNSGKTPARKFSVRGTVEPGTSTNEGAIIPGHGVVAPGGKYSTVLIIRPTDSKLPNLTVRGRVDYDSVFGNTHWSTFCYHLVPSEKKKGGDFSPCESGNDIDNNPP